MFPEIEYLEWISGRPEVAMYDLGTSDLRGERGHEAEVVPAPLEGLDDPPVGASLEMQIAAEYDVEPEQVLVTAGATQANVVATVTALGADSETDDESSQRALVEKPAYEPLVATPRAFDAPVDRFLRTDEYRLDTDRVKNALTPETGLVTVTNRHNPTGRSSDRETLAEIATIVRENDARLLVDEVYAAFRTDDETVDGPFGGVTACGLDGVVVTGSLTKFFGLGDLRIGWLVADDEFVDRARSVEKHFSCVAGPSRALAMRAFHNQDHLEARSRRLLEENAALLAEFVAERDDLSGFVEPGCTFAFLDPENAGGDAVAELAWERGLLVVPGRFFDDEARVRLSLGFGPGEMAAALGAFGSVLDDLANS